MEPNHIYQYSLLNALMDGVSDTGITAAQLSQRGNQGLGTFAQMDGELLMLDGKIYTLKGEAEGGVRESASDAVIPFAVSTQFEPQKTTRLALPAKPALDAALEAHHPNSANLFVTYRVQGRFASLRVRTVRGQEYPGQPLSELGKKQAVAELEGVEGTIVGFRTPANWQGFGVAGEHLHFIDEERSAGGHVLELKTAGDVELMSAVASNVHLELPTGEDFNNAKLVTDDEGVKKVEG